MAAGLISEDEFRQYVEHLLSVSKNINDNWEMRQSSEKIIYLYKRLSKLAKLQADTNTQNKDGRTASEESSTSSQQTENSEPKNSMSTEYSLEEEVTSMEDVDDLVSPLDSGNETAVTLVYEYHVVYSQSYSVPVLYFNVYKPDGSLLSLDDVWSTVPSVYRDRLQHERWTFLTQQEHPIIRRPFYMLHPCHTNDMMKQVLCSADTNNKNYLITWLSSVGPVVGLDLPLAYGLQNDDP